MFHSDRLKRMLDPETESGFLELSPLCGMAMEYGDIPRAGIITGQSVRIRQGVFSAPSAARGCKPERSCGVMYVSSWGPLVAVSPGRSLEQRGVWPNRKSSVCGLCADSV